MYPITEFEHLGEQFTPTSPVAADHPMVALRPDLFTPNAPKAARPTAKKSKE